MKKITHSGNLIIVGFGLAILSMSYLVYSCVINPTDLISNNYYEQELKYQDVIDAKKNTLDISNQFLIEKKENEIRLTIPQEINTNSKKINLQLYAVSDEKMDIKMDLQKNETGIYLVNTTNWTKKNATLKLYIETENKNYLKEFNF